MTNETQRPTLEVTFVGCADPARGTLIERLRDDAEALAPPVGRAAGIAGATQVEVLDLHRRVLATEERDYALVDAASHREFLERTLTSGSLPMAAVLVVGAVSGLDTEARRNAIMLRLAGYRRPIVLLEDFDRCGFDLTSFRAISERVEAFLAKFGSRPEVVIPIVGADGDNVARRSTRTRWYSGPTLLEALHEIPQTPERDHPFRFAVRDVTPAQPGRDATLIGRVEAGLAGLGATLRALPSDHTVRVRDVMAGPEHLPSAAAGDFVALLVDDSTGIAPGAILADPIRPPPVLTQARAVLFWQHGTHAPEATSASETSWARIATQRTPVRITRVRRRLDSETLEAMIDVSVLEAGDVAEVTLEFAQPIVAEAHDDLPSLARVTIERDDGGILAGGILTGDPA